jgi:hypothetical protein
MSTSEVLNYLAVWGIIGAFLFSLFVIFVFRSGLIYTSRNKDGLLKEKIPLAGYLTSGGFLVLIVVFLVAANYFSLFQNRFTFNFWSLFAQNFSLYLILFLFDSLVIDGFVLGYWRPGFLRIPDAMGQESMREHILKSIPVGILFGLIISLV